MNNGHGSLTRVYTALTGSTVEKNAPNQPDPGAPAKKGRRSRGWAPVPSLPGQDNHARICDGTVYSLHLSDMNPTIEHCIRRRLITALLLLTAILGGAGAVTACGSPSSPGPARAGGLTSAVEATPTAMPKAEPTSAVDLHFSGQMTGIMTNTQVDGTLCAPPGGRISAMVRGEVAGEPVTLQIIVNNVVSGDSQALVAMVPPLTGPAPTPGLYGHDPRSLSSYAGRVAIAPAGRSATMSADLAHGGGPVVVQVKGSWSC